jgi:hypothetical protein
MSWSVDAYQADGLILASDQNCYGVIQPECLDIQRCTDLDWQATNAWSCTTTKWHYYYISKF